MADEYVVCAPVGCEVVSTRKEAVWDRSRAGRDVKRPLEAGEVGLAGGAATVAPHTVLALAAAPAGFEGLAADRDPPTGTGAAGTLDDPNPHVAAAVVRVVSRPARQGIFKGPGDRP